MNSSPTFAVSRSPGCATRIASCVASGSARAHRHRRHRPDDARGHRSGPG
jgi:hypothetical protein